MITFFFTCPNFRVNLGSLFKVLLDLPVRMVYLDYQVQREREGSGAYRVSRGSQDPRD